MTYCISFCSHGGICEYISRAWALAEIKKHDQEILIRRWMGGWQAAEEDT